MKLSKFPALDLYVWGAMDESSAISLEFYSKLDLTVPDGMEQLAAQAEEEIKKVKRLDESYYDLGYSDNEIRCRCPLAYEFSESFF